MDNERKFFYRLCGDLTTVGNGNKQLVKDVLDQLIHVDLLDLHLILFEENDQGLIRIVLAEEEPEMKNVPPIEILNKMEKNHPGFLIPAVGGYMITVNRSAWMGGASIFYKGMTDKIIDKLGDDVLVIPSSVNIWGAVKRNPYVDYTPLLKTVKRENKKQPKTYRVNNTIYHLTKDGLGIYMKA